MGVWKGSRTPKSLRYKNLSLAVINLTYFGIVPSKFHWISSESVSSQFQLSLARTGFTNMNRLSHRGTPERKYKNGGLIFFAIRNRAKDSNKDASMNKKQGRARIERVRVDQLKFHLI